MTKPIETIQRALQTKFSVDRVTEQKLQFITSKSDTVEITHWFHALQIVRNNQPVATFYKVAECIKYLLAE